MGAGLLKPCLLAARPVLLALTTVLAWLIWGAATAQAAVPALDTDALLQAAASSPLAQSVAPPAPPVISSAGNVAAAAASTALTPAAGLTDALTATATPVLSGVSGTVTGLASDLPALPLPELLPVPVPVPLPSLPPLPTPAPDSVPIGAPSGLASGVAPEGDSALGPAPEPGQDTLAAVVAGIPLPDDAGAAGSDRRFGFAPARDLPGSGAHPAAMPGPSAPFDAPARQDPLRISALPAHAGHGSSPSSGGSSGAADIAESWPGLPATTGATSPPFTLAFPASPAFDPGSSPD